MNAIYVRVSTEEQAKTGYSVNDQIAACKNRYLAMGITDNIEIYKDEGYSGEFLDRPDLNRMRDDLAEKTLQNIMIYDPDRMGRNLTNQLLLADEIEKASAKLYFVTGDYDASPEGRLFFSMKGAVAAFEKEKTRERTLRGKRAKAKKGKIVINNRPFGFGWDDENSIYTIDEIQAKTVRLIYDLCLNNYWGSSKISQELNRRGIRNQHNKSFNYMMVYRILTKELYCGIAYSQQITTTLTGKNTRISKHRPKDEWIPIPIPAIVSRDDWEKAQLIIKQNSSMSKRNSKRDYLLTGLVRCGCCGMGMVASQTKSSAKQYYYRCVINSSPNYRSRNKCINRYIPVDSVENAIWDVFIDIANGTSSLSDFMRTSDLVDHSEEIKTLISRQEEIRKKKIDILKWYNNKLIDSEMTETELEKADKELTSITATLSGLQSAQKQIKIAPMISPEDILSASTFNQKRRVILHSGIVVYLRRSKDQFEFWFEVK